MRSLVRAVSGRVPRRLKALVPRSLRDALRRLAQPSPAAAEARKRAVRDAQAAFEAQDWSAAAVRWRSVIDQSGAEAPARAYQRLARSHRKLSDLAAAQRVIDQGLHRHPTDVPLLIENAELAMERRDWPDAAAQWRALLSTGSDAIPAKAFQKAARTHRRLGHLQDADLVLRRGIETHPDDVTLATEHAELASAQRDWPEAARRWDDVLRRFGDRAPESAYLKAAQGHAEQGDADAAEQVLARGLNRHPGAVALAVERVCIAALVPDGADVRTILHEVLDEHAALLTPALHVKMARRLLTAFEYDLADRVVDAGLERHPGDASLLRQRLRNAITRERRSKEPEAWQWKEALERSRQGLGSLATTTARDYLDYAGDLTDATAHDEAVALLREGLDRWPDSQDLQKEIATLAMARGAWREAETAWQRLLRAADDAEAVALRIRLSRARRCQRDYDGAREAVQVSDGQPAVVALVIEAAETELERRDVQSAIDVLEPLLEAHPGEAPIRAHRLLAMARQLAGEPRDPRSPGTRPYPPGLEANAGVVAIIGGGTSLEGVDLSPLRGEVHCVGVNATYLALPWVDQTVTHDPSHLIERFADNHGPVLAAVPPGYMATLGRLPSIELRRRIISHRLSELDDVLHSGGHTSAYTALNYAYLLRPRKIVLFGIDLTGFWGPDESWHRQMDSFNRRRFESLSRRPSFDQFVEYRSRKLRNADTVFASALPQLERAGIEVVNASPISSITCFRRTSPEEGIAEALSPAHPVAA